MVEKRYSWENGVKLEEHTRRKHKILRQYLARYLTVRCALPQQTKFRLAIVEGFAGGGRYDCGSPGSPLIFLEELRFATEGAALAVTSRSDDTSSIFTAVEEQLGLKLQSDRGPVPFVVIDSVQEPTPD